MTNTVISIANEFLWNISGTFQSVGFTAAYATLMTTSFSVGVGAAAGPTSNLGDFSNGCHAAWLSVI